MSVARSQTERFGANPFNIDGPFGVAGSGLPSAPFTLGTIAWGDAEAEWVYCSLTLASTTTIQPGMWVQWDKDYTATLLTTAGAVIGYGVGVLNVQSINSTQTGTASTISLPAGTYYVWVQRAGQAPCLVSASTTAALVIAETTATSGKANVPASATVSTKQITPVSFQAANFTFTATATNGSAVLTNISGASVQSGPFIGATLSQTTGITASQTVSAITYSPNGQITSITMSAAANGTNTATVTATGVLEGRLMWPYISKVN